MPEPDAATELDPSRTALLVMDYQPGIISRVPDPEPLVERVRRAIDAIRAAGATVAYVRVGFTEDDVAQMPETAAMAAAARDRGAAMHADAPGTQVDARLAPAADDIVVRKVRIGAFSSTDLDAQLRERGVDTLVLAGLATSGVVLSTVRDATDRDYRQLVLADGCADPDPEVHAFLTERIFPRYATILAVTELERSLDPASGDGAAG